MRRMPSVKLFVRKYDPEWSSHLPMLARIMLISSGPVMECGMGIHSTPILHAFCYEQKRQLFSYEENQAWYDAHLNWHSPTHTIELVKDWNTVPIEQSHWGVILIDHSANRRAIDAIRAANHADYVVLHDSNGRFEYSYHYDTVYPHYKYRYIYDKQPIHTTVVSNFMPVNETWKI
jgi:hypothetical protein